MRLYGMWASPFCLEVEVALKLKGIAFEYVQENLQEKSESLLRHNPIYQTVPVLVHHGRPVLESLVILEYVEDTWKEYPPALLPTTDPYKRSRVRFWLKFFYDKFVPPCRSIVVTKGEQQQEAIRASKESLRILEEGVGKDFPSETPFFHGATPGLLDIVVGSTWCWIRLLGELTGVELVSEETTPLLCRRLEAFEELPAVKESQPPHDRLTTYALDLRKKVMDGI